MSRVRKNIIYQALYQVTIAITPLITAPYIARVLGAENLGIYSYTYAAVSYFMLFAMLGITNYGSREVAVSYMQGKEKVSRTFSSVFFLQMLLSIIMIFLYILYVWAGVTDNKAIAYLQVLNIVGCLVDINWFFVGIEKIKVMAVRGIVIKIMTVISILMCVRDANDLAIYVLIMSLSVVLSNLVLWRYIFSELIFVKPDWKDVVTHIKPCIILFMPVLASSVYRIMDKTMVGRLSSYEQLGFYYNADKVINIPICLMSGISMVLLPRMTNYIHSKNTEKAGYLFSQAIDAFFCISCAIGVGIASVAEEFVPLFFGNGYEACITLVIIFSPVFIIKSISICIRNMYLIPDKKEVIYNVAILGGVVTNLIINILLIPRYGAKGAVLATLITEFVVCMIQIAGINKKVSRKIFRKQLIFYPVNAAVMYIVLHFAEYLNCGSVGKLMAKICVGVFVYILLCLLEWKKSDDLIFKSYLALITKKRL